MPWVVTFRWCRCRNESRDRFWCSRCVRSSWEMTASGDGFASGCGKFVPTIETVSFISCIYAFLALQESGKPVSLFALAVLVLVRGVAISMLILDIMPTSRFVFAKYFYSCNGESEFRFLASFLASYAEISVQWAVGSPRGWRCSMTMRLTCACGRLES